MTALLNALDTSTKTGCRNVALMSVMYCTAARIDEILSVKIENLKLKTQKPYIALLGKYSKIRTIYLTPNTVSHLKIYLKEFHDNLPNPFSYVFFQ